MTAAVTGHLDADEAALLESADAFLAGAHTMARTRSRRALDKGHDAAFWLQMAGLGWTAMRLPEELGGIDLPVWHAAALAEKLGHSLALDPFVDGVIMPSAVLRAAGGHMTAHGVAESLVAGTGMVAVAWQAAPGELAPQWSAVRIEARDGGAQATGARVLVEGAADQWLVAASAGDGEPRIVLVREGSEGVQVERSRMSDGGTTATLRFEGVHVQAQDILLCGAAAERALELALLEGWLVSAAQLTGLAAGALALAVEHTRTRKQFGQAIGDFQAARHRMVEAHLQVQMAGASWRQAARLLQADAVVNAASVSAVHAARARGAEAASICTRSAVQLHGAMGYTQEADIGLFLNGALRAASQLGTATQHRQRFASRAALEALAR